MTREEFVEAVKLHVRNSAVDDVISNLHNPPGRRVSPEERVRSDWYNKLSNVDVVHVNDIISLATHASLFGLFAAFDGVRKIVDDPGIFEVAYVGEKRVLLNDPQSIGLHELLNAAPNDLGSQ